MYRREWYLCTCPHLRPPPPPLYWKVSCSAFSSITNIGTAEVLLSSSCQEPRRGKIPPTDAGGGIRLQLCHFLFNRERQHLEGVG